MSETINATINEFLKLPLWVSIPLAMVYVGLVAYIFYVLWLYRREYKKYY
jgi:hypothetical protein